MATRIEKTDLARYALYDKVNTMIDEVNTKIDNKDSLPSQTGNAGKFLTTDGTNASWGEVKQIEIKQDLTNPSADTVPSTKAVKDESNRITTLMNTKVSNCITYIPQDIKLELNNGTLTLKAGSKVYVPNDSGVFDVVTIADDLTTSTSGTANKLLFYNRTTNALDHWNTGDCKSGTSWSGAEGVFYNTSTNTIKYTVNSGSTWNAEYSLPIGIATTDGGFVSIDQVFNGFGYIGSTVFALPGVKGLIPNGRNADGSLHNELKTLTSVKTTIYSNVVTQTSINIGITSNLDIDTQFLTYNKKENLNYNSKPEKVLEANVATLDIQNGKVTSFTPKTVFHALDYNDKSTISGWSMPSSRYIDLTLGAIGSTYTAPANGYMLFMKQATDVNQWIYLNNNTSTLEVCGIAGSSGWCRLFSPVKKGDKVRIDYNAAGANSYCRFIFAELEPYNPVSSSSGEEGVEVPDLE